MWKQVFSKYCMFILFLLYLNKVDCYHIYGGSSSNQKSHYLNEHLQRLQQQRSESTTVNPRLVNYYRNINNNKKSIFLNNSYNRYHITTESPFANDKNEHKLRHTRFSKIDGLITKIDNSESGRKVRWWTTTKRPYFDMGTDVENDEDDFDEYDDDGKDDFDWDEDDEDSDDEEEDVDEKDWQAEEATKSPETLTEFKWRHYGTRGGVEESRRNHHSLVNEAKKLLQQKASEHAMKMGRETKCEVPKPRVVSVNSVYPDPSKTYLPHCTILHQCGEDVGCCRNNAHTCVVKHQERVELYFYTKSVGRSDFVVEKLYFFNHTKCECAEKSSIMAGDRPQQKPHLKSGVNFKTTANKETAVAPTPIKRCKCPELYMPIVYGSHCSCDCGDGNRDCNRIKKGKEYFSLKDRKCIMSGECTTPSCEFGTYINQSGRCPRRQEKFDAFSRMSIK